MPKEGQSFARESTVVRYVIGKQLGGVLLQSIKDVEMWVELIPVIRLLFAAQKLALVEIELVESPVECGEGIWPFNKWVL